MTRKNTNPESHRICKKNIKKNNDVEFFPEEEFSLSTTENPKKTLQALLDTIQTILYDRISDEDVSEEIPDYISEGDSEELDFAATSFAVMIDQHNEKYDHDFDSSTEEEMVDTVSQEETLHDFSVTKILDFEDTTDILYRQLNVDEADGFYIGCSILPATVK